MEERRRYFRLDDEVILDFEPVSQDEVRRWKERKTDQRNELAELDRDIAALLHRLQAQAPVVAGLCELLNRKINLLHAHQPNTLTETEIRTRVNLSACGMSFRTGEPLAEHDNLRLQMQLKPSNVPVTLMGSIVGVEQVDDSEAPYLVRVNFDGLREAEQEILIHHLFQLQSRRLQANAQALNDAC